MLKEMQRADSGHAQPEKHWEYSAQTGVDVLKAKLAAFKKTN